MSIEEEDFEAFEACLEEAYEEMNKEERAAARVLGLDPQNDVTKEEYDRRRKS